MLDEIVARLINEQGDMETVSGNVTVTASEPPSESDVCRFDVLLMACGRPEAPTKARAILRQHPLISVIALTGNGHDATIYEMRPYERYVGTVSTESLIDTIREIRRC